MRHVIATTHTIARTTKYRDPRNGDATMTPRIGRRSEGFVNLPPTLQYRRANPAVVGRAGFHLGGLRSSPPDHTIGLSHRRWVNPDPVESCLFGTLQQVNATESR